MNQYGVPNDSIELDPKQPKLFGNDQISEKLKCVIKILTRF